MENKIRFQKLKDYDYVWSVQKKNKLFGFEFWYSVETFTSSKSKPTYENLVEDYAFYNRRSKDDLRFFKLGKGNWLAERKKSIFGFEFWSKVGNFYLNEENPSIDELSSTFSYNKSNLILSK